MCVGVGVGGRVGGLVTYLKGGVDCIDKSFNQWFEGYLYQVERLNRYAPYSQLTLYLLLCSGDGTNKQRD